LSRPEHHSSAVHGQCGARKLKRQMARYREESLMSFSIGLSATPKSPRTAVTCDITSLRIKGLSKVVTKMHRVVSHQLSESYLCRRRRGNRSSQIGDGAAAHRLGFRAGNGQPAPYPSLAVRARNGRVADQPPRTERTPRFRLNERIALCATIDIHQGPGELAGDRTTGSPIKLLGIGPHAPTRSSAVPSIGQRGLKPPLEPLSQGCSG
jgi:hypothetical protein